MNPIKTDVRFAPAYGVSEAARYNIPPSTLRSWISGVRYHSDRSNFEVIIVPPAEIVQLSFVNLVEAQCPGGTPQSPQGAFAGSG